MQVLKQKRMYENQRDQVRARLRGPLAPYAVYWRYPACI
jgi:hypothetical protein